VGHCESSTDHPPIEPNRQDPFGATPHHLAGVPCHIQCFPRAGLKVPHHQRLPRLFSSSPQNRTAASHRLVLLLPLLLRLLILRENCADVGSKIVERTGQFIGALKPQQKNGTEARTKWNTSRTRSRTGTGRHWRVYAAVTPLVEKLISVRPARMHACVQHRACLFQPKGKQKHPLPHGQHVLWDTT
jgi:hypothetical protein